MESRTSAEPAYTTSRDPVEDLPSRPGPAAEGADGSILTDKVLLRICRVSPSDPQATPEWMADLRSVVQLAVKPRLRRNERLEAAMTLLASALGRLKQFNPTHLPFGYNGPQVRSRDWIDREVLERVGKQIVGMVWHDDLPAAVALKVETAIKEALRVGFMEQQRYDAWRPGMPSGSGWRSAVTATPYGLARARVTAPGEPLTLRTPEAQGMQTSVFRSDGLDTTEVARAVRDFRHAMWEYLDSRDWVHRLSDEMSGTCDDRDRQERIAIRDGCNTRNANARQRVVETFPIILRQAENLGLVTSRLRDAIARNPTSVEVLREVEELVGRIEDHLRHSEEGAAIRRSQQVGGDPTAPRAVGAPKHPDNTTPPPEPSHAQAVKPDAEGPIVQIGRPGEPCVVLGRQKKPLTDGQYAVVSALLRAGEDGLTKDGLEAVRPSARRILKRVREDPDWAEVILLPGQTNGRYRIRG